MTTQKGRVVYDRKKNVLRPRDIARILDSYSDNLNGREFAEVVASILKITLDRTPRRIGFKLGFWLMLINLAGIPEDEAMREEGESKAREFFLGGEEEAAKEGLTEFERQKKGRFKAE